MVAVQTETQARTRATTEFSKTHRTTSTMPVLQVEPDVSRVKTPDDINTHKWGARRLVFAILRQTLKNPTEIESRFGAKITKSIGINEAGLDLSNFTNFFLHVINQFMIEKFGDDKARHFSQEIQKIVIIQSMLAFSSAVPRTPENVLSNLEAKLQRKKLEAQNSQNEPLTLIFTALLWSVEGITGDKRKKFNNLITKKSKTTH